MYALRNMYEWEFTRFTWDLIQMLGILLQIIVRGEHHKGETHQSDKQAVSLTRKKILKIPPPDGVGAAATT